MHTRTVPLSTTAQLGALLIGARKSLGLTQAELSTRLGMSQRRLSELERSPGTLSVDQLMSLCQQLGLQLQIAAGAPPEDAHSKDVNPLAPKLSSAPSSQENPNTAKGQVDPW